MKLVTYRVKGNPREQLGIFAEGGVIPVLASGLVFEDMNDLIKNAGPEQLKQIEELKKSKNGLVPEGKYELLSPIPRPKADILCLGLNYTEHAEEAFGYNETFKADADLPIFFSKRTPYSQGSGAPIPAHADITQKLDYENELAVVIGKDARNVEPGTVQDYIFGYTIFNDVSARDLQTSHKQWYFGKSLDGFSPMGPCIVTADEIAWPPALDIKTWVNGELRQDSNTRMLIHGIEEIVCTLSRGMTLEAGTVIATGTPKGVIMGMKDPVFLKSGDSVTCYIEGIGVLFNPVE
jgi:2-keto-4-pentenoate hydratase/2-oxohepta-3-ene-1,7-dioic acid hydratase in catechol pathway